jgi:hypothetical protein
LLVLVLLLGIWSRLYVGRGRLRSAYDARLLTGLLLTISKWILRRRSLGELSLRQLPGCLSLLDLAVGRWSWLSSNTLPLCKLVRIIAWCIRCLGRLRWGWLRGLRGEIVALDGLCRCRSSILRVWIGRLLGSRVLVLRGVLSRLSPLLLRRLRTTVLPLGLVLLLIMLLVVLIAL